MNESENDDVLVRLSAMQEKISSLESRIDSMERGADSRMNSIANDVLNSLTITAGQGVTVNGQGRNITVGIQPGQQKTATWTITCNEDGTMTGSLVIPGL